MKHANFVALKENFLNFHEMTEGCMSNPIANKCTCFISCKVQACPKLFKFDP